MLNNMSEKTKSITRDEILEAAKIAFRQYGYRKTTLDDISSLINRGKTGIYYYFKSKEEIFKEVIKKETQVIKEKIEVILAKKIDPEEKFRQYVKIRMEAFEHLGNYYSAMKHEILEQIPFINENRVDLDQAEISYIKSIISEGISQGIFQVSNLDSVAKTMLITFKSLEYPLFGTINTETESNEIILNLIELFLNGIRTRIK